MCAARVLDREVNPAHYDRLRVLLVCQPEKMADTQAFYCDVLGFHLEFEQAGEDGARLVALRNDGSRVMLGEPGALGVVPLEVSSCVVITLEHPNATGFHGLLERRDEVPCGPLRAMGGATFFALTDPSGHQVWVITYDKA